MKEWFQGAHVDEPPTRFWGWTIFGWVALLILFCAGLAWCTTAGAADVFESFDKDAEPMALRLDEQPCTNKTVTRHLRSWLLDVRFFKRARLTWKGKELASCWAVRNGVVISIDQEGEFFRPVPRHAFVPEGT